ncbi:Dienelactone hydrolase [Mycena sanguinolenta]|uniref:Dienelactone hydrolase n=1 Tax=Mycena sanguinolenta TaxID=230812 RepID=A0A8H6XFH3_9AGAR|nr:Dienelactone hydrolase [Mycena sanguinolenta]
MLITKEFHDVPSPLDGGVVVFSEIYQVTGPVERFAGSIASQGFVVACPSTYHEFEGPEAIPYDVEGRFPTAGGIDPHSSNVRRQGVNWFQIEKTVAAYDEDATLSIDLLMGLKNCNGRIAATGMCLGGHLAFRAAFDPRVLASVCFFATDIHGATLGKGGDDSLARVRKGDLTGKGELVMIFGKQDTHVPRAGRDLIRTTLEDANVPVSFLEVQAQHAFIRDESSKGRWDAALTRSLFMFMMEVFERTVGRDLGPRADLNKEPEHVC